jgi:hypothetical protein
MNEILVIDLEELRVSEIELLEELAGAPVDEMFAKGMPRGKVLRALGVVMKRREDPTFTLEQAGDLVIRLADGETNPTSAAS